MITTAERLRIAARHDESQGRMMNEAANLIEQQQLEIEGFKEEVRKWEVISKKAAEATDGQYSQREKLEFSVIELQRERDSLSAHVERFENAIRDLDEVDVDSHEYGEQLLEILSIANEQSPQTSLAEHDREVRARAIEDLAEAVFALSDDSVLINVNGHWIKEHANKIRNGKGGD